MKKVMIVMVMILLSTSFVSAGPFEWLADIFGFGKEIDIIVVDYDEVVDKTGLTDEEIIEQAKLISMNKVDEFNFTLSDGTLLEKKSNEIIFSIEKNSMKFNITANQKILMINPEEWGYEFDGEEVITSNSRLRFYDSISDNSIKVCISEPVRKYYDAQGIISAAEYDCIEYPRKNMNNFSIISNYSAKITFNKWYDPAPIVVSTNHTLFIPFNETSGDGALDYKGEFANNVSLTNDATFVEDAQGIRRLSLDGTGDSARSTNESELTWGSAEDLSICAVIIPRTNSTAANQHITCSASGCGGSGGGTHVFGISTTGKVFFQMNGCGPGTSTPSVTPNATQHVCGVFTNSDDVIKLYINGSLVSSSGSCNQNSGAAIPSTFRVGERDGGNFYQGNLSHIRMWTGYGLTADEVSDVFTRDMAIDTGPTAPTSIQCDDGNCNDTFTSDIKMNASGALDGEGDTITYQIQVGNFSNVTTVVNLTTIITEDSDTGSDIIEASGENCGGECKEDLFDRNIDTKWLLAGTTAWIKVKMSVGAKAIWSYNITSGNDAVGRDPVQWNIEGSNDNSTWIIIASEDFGGSTPWTGRKQTLAFAVPFDNIAEYEWYRWNITEIDSGGLIQSSELEYFEATVTQGLTTWKDVCNHTDGGSCTFDISGETVGEVYESVRSRSVDLDGANEFSDFFVISSALEIGTAVNDTCTYGGSGDFDIDCSDNCVVTSSTNIGGNDLSIIGEGTININADILQCGDVVIRGDGPSNKCIVNVNNARFCS